MAVSKGRRRFKKSLQRQFARQFDLERLDYRCLVRPARGKALLWGVLAAFVVYSAGFAIGYYGWQQQVVDYALFARLVWLLMLPATVVGIFSWLLVRNRLEYPLRQELKAYIAALEGKHGLLWRYGPLFAALAPNDLLSKQVVELSRQGRLKDCSLEDYIATAKALAELLHEGECNALAPSLCQEVQENLEQR